MEFASELDLVKARRQLLDDFVRENWETFGPNAIEQDTIEDVATVLYTGSMLLIRSRDMSSDDSEIVLKTHSGMGFSEQLGLLETVADMMRSD